MRVRSEAVRSLGLIGSPKAVRLLIKALDDKDYEIKQKAVRWLGETGEISAIVPLADIITKFDIFGRYYELKKESIEALSKIQSPDIIPVLEEASRRKWYQFGARHKELSALAKGSLEGLRGRHKN